MFAAGAARAGRGRARAWPPSAAGGERRDERLTPRQMFVHLVM